MKYFKSDTPSDYDINVGGQGADPKAEKTIMGFPPIAVYVGGAVLVLAGIYGLSRMMKNKNAQQQIQTPASAPVVAPVLQAAA